MCKKKFIPIQNIESSIASNAGYPAVRSTAGYHYAEAKKFEYSAGSKDPSGYKYNQFLLFSYEVHYYYPALLAMLKDEIYFLLHLQQHGRMYEVHYYYSALPFLSSWIFISCCAPHSSTLDSCSNAAGLYL
jgi:hypothetical protein